MQGRPLIAGIRRKSGIEMLTTGPRKWRRISFGEYLAREKVAQPKRSSRSRGRTRSHSIFVLFLTMGLTWHGSLMLGTADQLKKSSAASAHAAVDYYVSPDGNDSRDGSSSHPFLSIQRAANAAVQGDTVHVAPGIYSGGVTTTISGTASARIRFVSEEKWSARLVADGLSGIWLNRGNYIDIEGFEISGRSNQGILNYGSFVRVINNYVHDIQIDCPSSGSGINHANYSGSDNETIGNLVQHIAPTPGCKSDHGPGIYHANLRGSIVNNMVSYAREGVHLWHAANAVAISGNILLHNRAAGILVGAGDTPGGITADNCVVTNNTSAYNKFGIREFGSTGKNNKYFGNKVYANATDWLLLNGSSPQ